MVKLAGQTINLLLYSHYRPHLQRFHYCVLSMSGMYTVLSDEHHCYLMLLKLHTDSVNLILFSTDCTTKMERFNVYK